MITALVCHIDTVHNINNDVQVVQLEDVLLAIDTKTMKRYGIGGDDKVGVYITLELLKQFDNFKAVFFLDEEVGCVGSSKADFTFFNDSTIVLECDRRGYNDFVTSISGTKLSDDTLHNDIDYILDKYNRKKCIGGITDVGEIADNNPVQVANMSCGYYDPHSDNEYIIISEVESTQQMCFEILQTTANKRYEIKLNNRTTYGYVHTGYSPHTGQSWGYNYYDDWDNEPKFKPKNKALHNTYADSFKTTAECPCCSTNEVWYDDYEQEFFCLSCHTYVDVDDKDVNIDAEYMSTISDEEFIEADTLLYDASFNKEEFKKDVEPKLLNNGI